MTKRDMTNGNEAFVIVGGAWGDEGKGKIAHSKLEQLAGIRVTSDVLANFPTEDRKKIVGVRYNGGANAGHTQVIALTDESPLVRLGEDGLPLVNKKFHFSRVEKTDKGWILKLKTRSLPSSVMVPGVSAMIGPRCVVHLETLRKEIEDMQTAGVRDIHDRLYIAFNAHVVEDYHQHEDRMIEARKAVTNGKVVGTTGQGIGPCNAGKANRFNRRVEDVPEFQELGQVVDTRKQFQNWLSNGSWKMVGEGAQSMMLDIDWGNYPCVTSAGTYPMEIFSTGLPMSIKMNVIMTLKAYTTKVGKHAASEFMKDAVANIIADIGGEYGTVTGRRRQVEYLNLDWLSDLMWSIQPANGDLIVVINKGDILPEVAAVLYDKFCQKQEKLAFGFVRNGKVQYFDDLQSFEAALAIELTELGVAKTIFSHTPMADPDMFN